MGGADWGLRGGPLQSAMHPNWKERAEDCSNSVCRTFFCWIARRRLSQPTGVPLMVENNQDPYLSRTVIAARALPSRRPGMTEFVGRALRSGAVWCAIASAAAVATTNAARADSPGIGCTKVENFIAAIQEYKPPFTNVELSKMSAPLRNLAVQDQLERYTIPRYFEITRSIASRPETIEQNRNFAPMSINVGQGRQPVQVEVSAVAFVASDEETKCSHRASKHCFGVWWFFINAKNTVGFHYLGTKMHQRNPSVSVFETKDCNLMDEANFARPGDQIGGLRIP